VAEGGTLTGAGRRLCISQSAGSLALGELERAPKVQLCVRREAHGITLTPPGKRLLAQAHTPPAWRTDTTGSTCWAIPAPADSPCWSSAPNASSQWSR